MRTASDARLPSASPFGCHGQRVALGGEVRPERGDDRDVAPPAAELFGLDLALAVVP